MVAENGENDGVRNAEVPVAHACFLLEQDKNLHVSGVISDYSAWHYLSNCIVRNPRNLHNHTRRILHCRKKLLNDYLPGALQDLFYTLDNRGYQLRTNLLYASQNYMIQEYKYYFKQWIIDQHQPENNALSFRGALLSLQVEYGNSIYRAVDQKVTTVAKKSTSLSG